MNNEIISKSNVGSNILFADEDAVNVDGGASRLVTSWMTSKGLTNAEEDTCSRNVQSFTTFRASGLSAIARRDWPMSDDNKMLNHRRESSQQHYARQSSVQKTSQSEEIQGALSRYENAGIKYQKSKPRPKRQISRERQQQQQQSNYSSSDESVARNKSKSTSSIDTQSVNNILDEYEDLDYCRSSDFSDVSNISVTNFEAIMMDQQKRQQIKSKLSSAKIQTKSIPTREKVQPVLKVNQQTQVRQRSRDRQKDSNKVHQQDTRCVSPPVTVDTIESSRSKMPEILLRKGEVQKRVDEWLNQAHSQNFPVTPREKPLTRSNSSAEQKSQRRYRGQDLRSRSSIDEARDRLNGGTSSSYDDLTRVNRRLERGRPEKVNVGVNTSRSTYKEYLAVRSKQQDYGFSAQSSVTSSRSGDSNNPISRIPQRGLLGSSFKSKRAEANLEEKATAASRIINLTKAMIESEHGRTTVNSSSKLIEVSTGTTSSIISCRRSSLKRSGNGVDENCATVAAHLLGKEEMDPSREPGLSKGLPLPGGSVSDHGEPISPNKDGESRRPAAMASGSTPRPVAADKTVETVCKSTEVSTRCAANYSRGNSSRIASSAESDRDVAIESPRRRLQFCSNIRKEPKSINQSRQEQPIYGSAVSARVRALQGQMESCTPRCHQASETSLEVRRPRVLPRKDLGESPSRDAGLQDRAKVSIGAPSSSFKPNNRVYTAISDSQQQPNEQNATKSKIAVCENVPSIKVTRYASPDHVERIYERSLQPQVIHADDLESVLRPSLQASPYGEKLGVYRLDQESAVKEMSSTLEDETFDRIGESRHEHLETIEEDDRKSESSIGRYPEIGLKQCLKVQKSLPNSRSKESADKRKDNPIYVKWNQQQQVVLNEPARTFATFQSASSGQNNVKTSVRSRSPEIKESRGHEEIRQDPDESTITLQDFVAGYKDASREDQDQLMSHSRENSNLSTATIPMDELESQESSRLKTEEDPSQNKLQFGEKLQDRVAEEMKSTDERSAVVNEVLVKNLQFEQDLPENPVEQTRQDHVIQQVNFHNILCDDYENEKLKNTKMYMTKEEMEHRRLIDMLKRGNFETLKTVSNTS